MSVILKSKLRALIIEDSILKADAWTEIYKSAKNLWDNVCMDKMFVR